MTGRNITKKELSARIGEKVKLADRDVCQVIQLLLDNIIEDLGAGNRFELREFGVFEVVERKAKKARNPRTGAEVMIPAKKVVKFKNGRIMKERISGGKS